MDDNKQKCSSCNCNCANCQCEADKCNYCGCQGSDKYGKNGKYYGYKSCCAKLNSTAFGVSSGLVWGIWVFIVGILAMYYPMAQDIVDFFNDFYIGYDASIPGSLIGFLWGFADFFVFAFLIAFIYNKLNSCFSRHCRCDVCCGTKSSSC